jgi:hypothetical protein
VRDSARAPAIGKTTADSVRVSASAVEPTRHNELQPRVFPRIAAPSGDSITGSALGTQILRLCPSSCDSYVRVREDECPHPYAPGGVYGRPCS